MHVLVFDSGIGGLGIVLEMRALMPTARITYLMDNAAFPYGGKPEAELTARVCQVVGAGIVCLRPDIVVIACNTASTTALSALRTAHALPFVGCVPPVKSAAAASHSRTIAVLATPATVRGRYLSALAALHAADCRTLIHGAPNLARLAERRFAGDFISQREVAGEVAGLLAQPGADRIDAVALGCTHYAKLLQELKACLPPATLWFDPARPVAMQVQRFANCGASTASDLLPEVLLTTAAASPIVLNGFANAGFNCAGLLDLHPGSSCTHEISGVQA